MIYCQITHILRSLMSESHFKKIMLRSNMDEQTFKYATVCDLNIIYNRNGHFLQFSGRLSHIIMCGTASGSLSILLQEKFSVTVH